MGVVGCVASSPEIICHKVGNYDMVAVIHYQTMFHPYMSHAEIIVCDSAIDLIHTPGMIVFHKSTQL